MNNYQRLLAAIIYSGVLEKDKEYFNSPTFKLHCKLLEVNADNLRQGIMRKIDETVKRL